MDHRKHRKKKTLFFSLCCFFLWPTAYSAADANPVQPQQIEKRLEQELQALHLKYQELKTQIQKNKRTTKKAFRRLRKKEQALKIRGFFTAGVATTDGKSKIRLEQENQEIGDEPNFQSDAIVGLQLDASINNKTRYTHQMTTVGYDLSHTVKTEWAYFSYELTNNTTIKAGRLRVPFFLLSESVDVGFTYPWVRPPIEIYTLPMSGYEGATLEKRFSIGNGYGRASVFVGSGQNSVALLIDATLSLADIKGISLNYNLGDFQFHFSYLSTNAGFAANRPCDEDTVTTHIDEVIAGSNFDFDAVDCAGVDTLSVAFDYIDNLLSIDPSIGELYTPESWKGEYTNLALKYDNGISLVIAEYGEVKTTGYLNPLGPGGYILYGHRLEKWLPYFSIGSFVTSDITKNVVSTMSDRIGSPVGGILVDLLKDAGVLVTYHSYTVGTNYWINTNLRAKLEIAHYEHFKGTNGFFLTNPGSHNAVYSLAISGVF